MKEVKGYKAFNKDKTNRYGLPFTEGISYRVGGDISFGNTGNGFHMCTHLSDVFRYFDAIDDDVVVAEVIGRGDRRKFNDEYEGYYDMYAVRELYVSRFMTREEVIAEMLTATEHDVIKFIKTFKMTGDEKIDFLYHFRDKIKVVEHLLYYQYGYKKVFQEHDGEEQAMRIRLVNKDGQDNR